MASRVFVGSRVVTLAALPALVSALGGCPEYVPLPADAGTDGATDGRDLGEAGGQQPGTDAGSDRTATPEAGPNTDAKRDGAPDLAGNAPDAAPDSAPDVAPDLPPDLPPDAPPCTPGGPCLVAGPCLKGTIVCSPAGLETCLETPMPDGTPCTRDGTNGVCGEGACDIRCGSPCDRPAGSCKVHRWSCPAGKYPPTCAETAEIVDRNTSCGASKLCDGQGACLLEVCQMGLACGDAACGPGTIVCTSATEGYCQIQDADKKPNGTRCAPGKICRAGRCETCAGEGGNCRTGCKLGKLSCDNGTGEPACVPASNVTDGSPCDPPEAGKFCRQGECVTCAMEGTPCEMGCRTGTIQCTNGQLPQCVLTGNAPNGTLCGTNLVCSNGTCQPACPNAGQACPLAGSPCKTAVLMCQDAKEICVVTGNKADGVDCGGGKVCKMGACDNPCPRQGMACEVAGQPCKTGKYDCSSGSELCVADGNKAPGTVCPTGTCDATGTCTCPTGTACAPGGNQCRTGSVTGCTGTTQTCMDTGAKPDRTACGTGMACQGGTCKACDTADYCGATCIKCPTPPLGAVATCVSGQCDWTCDVGYFKCGSICVAASGVVTCTSCGDCTPPTSGVLCTDALGGCGWTCGAGTHTCPTDQTQCYPDSQSKCGPSCMTCGWNQTCKNGACSP